MAGPFLSRHFLAEQARCATLLPFPPAAGGPAHSLLALGSWAGEEARLTIADLAVTCASDDVAAPPALSQLASFAAPAAVAAVAAADLGGGRVLLLAAGADGSLGRLRMQVPTAPGSQPEQIQLQSDDFDGPLLLPWVEPHRCAVAGLDIQPDVRAAVTAAVDGSLALTPLDAPGGAPRARLLWSCGGAVSFTGARWAGPNAVVTASLQGQLAQWDARAGGPAARPALQAAAAGGQPLTCLDVHPAQSYSCAAGDAAGVVHVWDLRRAGTGEAALAQVGGSNAAAVTSLSFDAVSATSAAVGGQQLVYGTAAGEVGVLAAPAHGAAAVATAAAPPARRLYQEPAAGVVALCLGAAGPSSQLLCLTEQEGLVFLGNAL
eukprot:scaffold12.g8210.t1